MTQVEDDQTPASANRNSLCHRDKTSVSDESQSTALCARGEERRPSDSGVKHSDSEGEDEEEEEHQASSSPTDAAQVRVNNVPAPDGGWGWVVLLATMLALSLSVAFPSSMGIFFKDLQTEFDASTTETSWVPAVMTAVLNAGGPLCSMLVECFGCRATVMLGGLLSGLGMAVTSQARTLTDIYITSGITGLGFCFSFQPSVTIIGHYFVRRRVFANALSSTGIAVGLSVLPLIANLLLGQFGWRGSFLILGGMLLNCCVCGAVMRPVTPSPNKCRSSCFSGKPRNPPNDKKKKSGFKDTVKTSFFTFIAFLHRHIAFDLLVNNARYRAYALSVTWMTLGYVVPLVYLVPYAIHNNVDKDHAAFLMSVLGLVNIAVRPTAALVMGMPRFRGNRCFVYLFGTAVLVNGLTNCICGSTASFEALLAYVVIFGLSMAVAGSLLFTVLMDTVEMRRFPAALGLLCLMQSGTMLFGPPLAGMLVDHTGQYSYVFYACSAVVFSGSVFLMVSFCFLDHKRDMEKKRRKKKESMETQSDLYQKPVVTLEPDCQHDNSKVRTPKNTIHVSSV